MGIYRPGDYIKVEFRHEQTGESEWMWVRVKDADNEQRLVFGWLDSEPIVNTDLPPEHVPHVKLEFCHFMSFNAAMPRVPGDDTSMNCAA